jgi:hypothetical protein
MWRRRLRWLLALAGLAVLVAGVVVLWPRPERITPEKVDRIHEGMSRAEVEAILGGPPGDYRTVWTEWEGNDCDEPFNCGSVDLHSWCAETKGYQPDLKHSVLVQGELVVSGNHVVGDWFGNDGCIEVCFSPEVVTDKDFLPTVRRERALFDNLFWRTRRLWHRWFP